MNDAELAGKLDGMDNGLVGIVNVAGCLWVTTRNQQAGTLEEIRFEQPSDLLAFCRAVVERVDGERCPQWQNGSCLIGLAETKGETL